MRGFAPLGLSIRRQLKKRKQIKRMTTIALKKFSLSPNKLSLYNVYERIAGDDDFLPEAKPFVPSAKMFAEFYGEKYEPVQRFHNFKISETAQKTIKQKINWLYFLSKSKTIKTYSGKVIPDFRLNFATVTLPSKQLHPTKKITQECFNQLLTELRTRVNLKNYVWRLEFQKNGNVHYHLVTDVYIDFHFLQRIWNRIIEKLGYVAEFQNKMQAMSLLDYWNSVKNYKGIDFSIAKKRYFNGVAEKWSKPNSVDVKSVKSKNQIAGYIAKYFGKDKGENPNCNENDTKENSMGMRLWFCSQSLSKLDKVSDFVDAMQDDLISIVCKAKDYKVFVHEYCTTLFFSINKIYDASKKIITNLLLNYAQEKNYCPSP